MDALRYLLGPTVSVEEFFNTYWLQAPLHIPNKNAAHWDELFNVECDVESMWRRAKTSSHILYFPSCKGNSNTPQRSATKLPSPFYAYANRFSVVLNRADQYSSAIRTICEALARPSDSPVEGGITHFPFAFCNVYLTPPNAQTVPKHSDDRDVLLLQVMGDKEWMVYRDTTTPSGMPVWLPYRDEEVGKAADRPAPVTLQPELKVTVKQGDFLYLPRGFVHEASTSDTASLHLTIALQTSDWDLAGALGRSVTTALRTHPSLLPLTRPPRMGELSGVADVATLDALVNQVVDKLTEGAEPIIGGAAIRRDFAAHIDRIESARRESFPLLPPSLNNVSIHPLMGGPSVYARFDQGVLPLTASTQLMWVPTIEVLGIEMVDQEVAAVPLVITFGDTTLKRSMQLAVSEEVAGVVTFLSKKGPFPVPISDLPCLLGGDSREGVLLRQICTAEVLLQSSVIRRFRN